MVKGLARHGVQGMVQSGVRDKETLGGRRCSFPRWLLLNMVCGVCVSEWMVAGESKAVAVANLRHLVLVY